MPPAWRLDLFDAEGPWGRGGIELQHIWDDIFPKLKNYESMRWGEILKDQRRNHSVRKTALIKEAQERLIKLRLDDIDELFRFRLTGEQRVWGIRDGFVFSILWWDPFHAICPSTLRNT
jgi:hypothetical protein